MVFMRMKGDAQRLPCIFNAGRHTSRCGRGIAVSERVLRLLWGGRVEPIGRDAGVHMLPVPASRLAMSMPLPASEPMQGADAMQARLQPGLQHPDVRGIAIVTFGRSISNVRMPILAT